MLTFSGFSFIKYRIYSIDSSKMVSNSPAALNELQPVVSSNDHSPAVSYR